MRLLKGLNRLFTFTFGGASGDTFEMDNNGIGDAGANKGFVETDKTDFKIVDMTYANINAVNDNTESGYKTGARSLKVTLSAASSKWVLQQNGFTYQSDSVISIKNYALVDTGNNTFSEADGKRYTVAAAANTVEKSVTVTYTKGLIDRTAGVDVASFDIGWTADPEAPAGAYSATIAVTVEVV